MDSDITLYAASYVLTRLGLLAAFGYLAFLVLRPARARSPVVRDRHDPADRKTEVPDDRC